LRAPQWARASRWASIATAALVVVVGAGQLLANAGLSVRGCVEARGLVGWLGMRLMLLHSTPSCPAGTMAAGPSDQGLLTVLGCVTLAAAVAHAAGLAFVVGTARRIRKILTSIVRVLTVPRILALVPAPPTLDDDGPSLAPIVSALIEPRPEPLLTVRALRAPPVFAS